MVNSSLFSKRDQRVKRHFVMDSQYLQHFLVNLTKGKNRPI